MLRARRIAALFALAALLARSHAGMAESLARPSAASFMEPFDVRTFLKGNLHTHTNVSDGGNEPADVIAWYKTLGYDFLALTDHNVLSRPADYSAFESRKFTLIAGEEISMRARGLYIHVNALCTGTTVGGGSFDSAAAALRRAFAAIDQQGGVALVNHPNFGKALTLADLLAAPGARLLEIWSGHPYAYSAGIADRPSHEALWDLALGAGLPFVGVAVDDTHHLIAPAEPPAYPGVGWVQVFTGERTEPSICEALRRGRLYASTGAELRRIRVSAHAYELWPRQASTVVFIGSGGRELSRQRVLSGAVARYEPTGDEVYVRARIEADSARAWTPPARLLTISTPAKR